MKHNPPMKFAEPTKNGIGETSKNLV